VIIASRPSAAAFLSCFYAVADAPLVAKRHAKKAYSPNQSNIINFIAARWL
jgi:hypothetical protein